MNRADCMNPLRKVLAERVITFGLMREVDDIYIKAACNGPLGILIDPVFIRYIRLINARHERTSVHSGDNSTKRRLAAFASHRGIEESSHLAVVDSGCYTQSDDNGLGRGSAHPFPRFSLLIRDLFSPSFTDNEEHKPATMAVHSATPARCHAVVRGCSPISGQVH